METQIAPSLDALRIAASLIRAIESGDLGRLESVVGQAAGQLRCCRPASSFETERRELLASIVQSLGGALRRAEPESRKGQLEVCHDLLRQLRGGGVYGAFCAQV